MLCIVTKEDLKIDQRALFPILYLRFKVTGYLAQTANITHTHLNRHFTLRFFFCCCCIARSRFFAGLRANLKMCLVQQKPFKKDCKTLSRIATGKKIFSHFSVRRCLPSSNLCNPQTATCGKNKYASFDVIRTTFILCGPINFRDYLSRPKNLHFMDQKLQGLLKRTKLEVQVLVQGTN